MSPAPLQEQSNGAHDGAGSKQRQSTTGTIPKASAKTNRQRMSTMAAEAASANDAGGGSSGGGGEDARARDGASESAVRDGGEMQYVYGDDDQDHQMPPQMEDFSTERLRIRQDNLRSLHHHHHRLHQQQQQQQQPWRTNTAEQTAKMDDVGAEAEGGSIGSAGRRRQLLDSIPSQQILMVKTVT